MRAQRAIRVPQTTRRFARLAQILRRSKGAPPQDDKSFFDEMPNLLTSVFSKSRGLDAVHYITED
jgi:hypothetical protein